MGTASDRGMPNRFSDIVRANIPGISNSSIAKLQSMYMFQPELPEKLAWDYTTDIVFGCSAVNIASAYGERARRYLFSVPPATHGSDVACKSPLSQVFLEGLAHLSAEYSSRNRWANFFRNNYQLYYCYSVVSCIYLTSHKTSSTALMTRHRLKARKPLMQLRATYCSSYIVKTCQIRIRMQAL